MNNAFNKSKEAEENAKTEETKKDDGNNGADFESGDAEDEFSDGELMMRRIRFQP